jgi:hypothetical protein
VVHFTIYTRSYCHLCDDMLNALRSLGSEFHFSIELIDVDSDAALQAQYDELVPVLFGRRGDADLLQLCHYFFDEAKARALLSQR